MTKFFAKIKKWYLLKKDLKMRVDPEIIKKTISDPDFPFLISYPRTGSHWLRMILALYTGKPSMPRLFYYRNAKIFTVYHTHDVDLKTYRKNVIYLYRNPVDTVFSNLNYFNLDITDKSEIIKATNEYLVNLKKWLIEDNFTTKKTIITYDKMRTNINIEFKKICNHLNIGFDANRLQLVLKKIDKKKLKRLTKYNKQIVNINPNYKNSRIIFREDFSGLIYKTIEKSNPEIIKYFNQNDF